MTSAGAEGLAVVGLALAFPVLLSIAALSDLLRYLIPNWIPLALVGLAVPAVLLSGSDLGGLAWHMATGIGVLGLTSILFFRGLIGGGDAKLLAAAACWTGWPLVVPLIVYTAVAGGLLATVLVILRHLCRNRDLKNPRLKALLGRVSGIPYGIAIAAGGWLVWAKLSVYGSAF